MQHQSNIVADQDLINHHASQIQQIPDALSKVIVGQKAMIEALLTGLLCNGHILLEGVPGLAKTLTIKSLAKCIKADFSRIQFTPDLLPADVIGTNIYQQQTGNFTIRKGPIFANIVLADEINRAPAKVQSALLEAMQEQQVTIGDTTFHLPQPFLVMATQNPIEQEGTYPLPEAQVDRFMMKIKINYPSKDEEIQILRQQLQSQEDATINSVVSVQQLMDCRKLVEQIYLDGKIEQYIVDIVFATRFPKDYLLHKLHHLIAFGVSPRATIYLAKAAKAQAFLQKRNFVIPEDIKAIAVNILNHRIGLSYEAQAENIQTEEIINQILQSIQVP